MMRHLGINLLFLLLIPLIKGNIFCHECLSGEDLDTCNMTTTWTSCQEGCYNTITNVGTGFQSQRGCMSADDCIKAISINPEGCPSGVVKGLCVYCCMEQLCNHDNVTYTNTAPLMISSLSTKQPLHRNTSWQFLAGTFNETEVNPLNTSMNVVGCEEYPNGGSQMLVIVGVSVTLMATIILTIVFIYCFIHYKKRPKVTQDGDQHPPPPTVDKWFPPKDKTLTKHDFFESQGSYEVKSICPVHIA